MNSKILYLSLLSFMLIGIISCNKSSQENQVDVKDIYIDSIENENYKMNEFIDLLSLSMDSLVNQEGNIIKLYSGELQGENKRELIKNDLQIFSDILARQREKIANLRDSLKLQSGANARKMEKIIAYYENELASKEATITRLQEGLDSVKSVNLNLQENISSLSANIAELNETNQQQQEIMQTQDELLNEGYVIMGTKKELSKEGILTSGGLFKKKKLNISNLKAENCMKIDIRDFSELPINGKNPKILSSMPENSYTLQKIDKNHYILKINNVAQFWGVSNYLVVQYD